MASVLDMLAQQVKPNVMGQRAASPAVAPAPAAPVAAPGANGMMPTNMPPVDEMPGDGTPPAPPVAANDGTKRLDPMVLADLARTYDGIFTRFKGERQPVELRWLRNLRQYMGVYDPEIEKQLPTNRSRAYPRITRTKTLQLLARIMNLMFPGDDQNWQISASPCPEMDPHQVADAVGKLITKMQAAGMDTPLTQDLVDTAIKSLADDNAAQLSKLIEDQLDELGSSDPNDKLDWVAMNRAVLNSGIKYGVGVLEGPYVRAVKQSGWELVAPPAPAIPGAPPAAPDPSHGFQAVTRTIYKPAFNLIPVWDFFPDMTATSLPGEGYFIRKVLSAHQLKKLKKRPDFQAKQIDELLNTTPNGNYRALWWETELRAMGTAINADVNSNVTANRNRYEVVIYRGPIDAQKMEKAGVEMENVDTADDMFVEMWICAGTCIKLDIDPWRKLGETNSQVHVFSFDEDDTSPISQGLPYVMRDSQMSVCAATRMALDNASVVCGPNLEINTALLDPSQDVTGVFPYKVWKRIDDGATAAWPAVREIQINSHLTELTELVQMFEQFAESETFINAGNGGDMSNMPSEPMRTMAGASMVSGNVALPFKDIVRNYDTFTQSVLSSLVTFNKVFNPDDFPAGDYTVIARGATSLIAREVRGAALDSMAQTMQPDERIHVDIRKMTSERLATRDLSDILRPIEEVKIDQAQQAQQAQQQQQMTEAAQQATIDKTKADTYKSATQGQKNAAGVNKTNVEAATHLMDAGVPDGDPNAAQPQPEPAANGQ